MTDRRPSVQHVTDHALLRYLERHCGIDVRALRAELGSKTLAAVRMGAASVSVGNITFTIRNGMVTTSKPRAHDRFRRKRGQPG